MTKSHLFKLLAFLALVLLLIVPSSVSAAKTNGPDPWSPEQVYYQPYNSSISQNITIQNSTYIVDESGLVPVEWFAMFFIVAFILFAAALFVERANDLTPVISAVMYYILAYQGSYLSYHSVEVLLLNMETSEIYIVPYTEVFHLFFVSAFCLGMALVMTVLSISRVSRELMEMTQQKGGKLTLRDILFGRD